MSETENDSEGPPRSQRGVVRFLWTEDPPSARLSHRLVWVQDDRKGSISCYPSPAVTYTKCEGCGDHESYEKVATLVHMKDENCGRSIVPIAEELLASLPYRWATVRDRVVQIMHALIEAMLPCISDYAETVAPGLALGQRILLVHAL